MTRTATMTLVDAVLSRAEQAISEGFDLDDLAMGFSLDDSDWDAVDCALGRAPTEEEREMARVIFETEIRQVLEPVEG